MMLAYQTEVETIRAANEIIAEQASACARLAAAVRTLLPAAIMAGEMLRALGRTDEAAVLFRAEATARNTLTEVIGGRKC